MRWRLPAWITLLLALGILVGVLASWRPWHTPPAYTIHPPLVRTSWNVRGQELVYTRFNPSQRYTGIEVPDYPFFVGIGDPDPYRRVRRYDCSTNAQGFRGPREWKPRKEPGVIRVAAIGDGITFGEGVDDTRDWPYLLQDLLGDGSAARWEVLNLGIPCQLTDDAVPFFHTVRDRIDVDLYLLVLGVNDALPMFHRSAAQYRTGLRALLDAVDAAGVPAIFVVDPANTFYPDPPRYKEFSAILEEEVKSRLPMVDLPSRLDADERVEGLRFEDLGGGQQELARYEKGVREALVSVSYTPSGGRYIAPKIYRYLDRHDVHLANFITDCHLNEQGHRVVAGVLKEAVLSWRAGRGAPSTPAGPASPGR